MVEGDEPHGHYQQVRGERVVHGHDGRRRTIETYRAPQLLRKEKVAVPFDPASARRAHAPARRGHRSNHERDEEEEAAMGRARGCCAGGGAPRAGGGRAILRAVASGAPSLQWRRRFGRHGRRVEGAAGCRGRGVDAAVLEVAHLGESRLLIVG